MMVRAVAIFVLALGLVGCGTTRWTDTSRTATEQLLISDAIDRSVSRIDFQVLNGQNVYLDTTFLNGVVDKEYLVSTLRQHMLASGCTMKEKKEDADFIVEARAGAVGTDRHDLLYGMPSFNLPWTPITGTPAVLPEIALAKRTDQKGVAKVAVFAYHRTTGEPVWQSGVDTIASKAQNSWWLGMGPIQRGTIYDKAQFAGRDFRFPLFSRKEEDEPRTVRVTRETTFNDPHRFAMHNNDGLSKFGELLRSSSNSGSTSLAADSSNASVFQSPEKSWLNDSFGTPIETQASGALISSPVGSSAASSSSESAPVGRLLGPARHVAETIGTADRGTIK
jgi:hypothetical protein